MHLDSEHNANDIKSLRLPYIPVDYFYQLCHFYHRSTFKQLQLSWHSTRFAIKDWFPLGVRFLA